MSGRVIDLEEVEGYLQGFAEDRDWIQYHTPKNLAMALVAEAGELVEIFQWLTPEESAKLDGTAKHAAGEELADILQYLIRLADLLDVDLHTALWDKLRANEVRFPP
jgi:NTP pyrophosphatase (non-canonical NTP hydrolase)